MANPRNLLLDKIEQLVTPVLTEHQVELVDLEFQHEHGQWILRFYLDKAGGITLDDCGDMSHQISTVLDATDPIPQAYSLEVSSPGIYRPLRKEKDFRTYVGEPVEISLYAPLDGRRHFKGVLESVTPETITVVCEKKSFKIPFVSIAKAKLDPEIQI